MNKNSIFNILVCIIILVNSPEMINAQTISTIAGCGLGNDSLALNAEFISLFSITGDTSGNIYIGDRLTSTVRKINTSGVVSIYAGNGVSGYTGDGGQATAAQIGNGWGICFDRHGNLYIADHANSVIRKVDASGIITTFAGTGAQGYNGDNIIATTAKLYFPWDVAIDTSGNLYIADGANFRVRKVNTSGIISTVAGTGAHASGAISGSGAATATSMGEPGRIALDRNSNLYIATFNGNNILKVDTAGILSCIAGNGTYGYTADGGPATAAIFGFLDGIKADTAGNICFSDNSSAGRIRMIERSTGILTTIAGNGTNGDSGDGGPATAAGINYPNGLFFDVNNKLFICDAYNDKIKTVSSGIISTYAGRDGHFGEGYTAINAQISNPMNLATDAAGNVYIVDQDNNRIRKVNVATGLITTVAGTGVFDSTGFGGDGGPATLAQLYNPTAVAVDRQGNLYIADVSNMRIRKVNTSGIISTFAGSGVGAPFNGDGIMATDANMQPSGVAVDTAGNVYIADNYGRIRMVDTSSIINTVAGNSTNGFSGDGSPAISAQLNGPQDIAVDNKGNLYISDFGNNELRKVDINGIITSMVQPGVSGFSGDGGPSISATINGIGGVKTDTAGNVYFADINNQRIRMISTSGIISTVAGSGIEGFSGDGGLAVAARLNLPQGVGLDMNGNLYIADTYNERVRKVNLNYLSVPGISASIGNLNVFPTPAQQYVTVTLQGPLSGQEHITLFNLLGQEVYQAPLLHAMQTIDLAGLPGGVYVLQLSNEDGTRKTVKVVKE